MTWAGILVFWFLDDGDRGGSQHVGLLALQPPNVAVGPKKCIEFGRCESFILNSGVLAQNSVLMNKCGKIFNRDVDFINSHSNVYCVNHKVPQNFIKKTNH